MRTISLNVACTLILFKIEAPVHGGLEADFKEESFIRYVTVSQLRFSDPLECFVNDDPAPFKCRITPRSEESSKLIRSLSAESVH